MRVEELREITSNILKGIGLLVIAGILIYLVALAWDKSKQTEFESRYKIMMEKK